jgi:hypothetical protein
MRCYIRCGPGLSSIALEFHIPAEIIEIVTVVIGFRPAEAEARQSGPQGRFAVFICKLACAEVRTRRTGLVVVAYSIETRRPPFAPGNHVVYHVVSVVKVRAFLTQGSTEIMVGEQVMMERCGLFDIPDKHCIIVEQSEVCASFPLDLGFLYETPLNCDVAAF